MTIWLTCKICDRLAVCMAEKDPDKGRISSVGYKTLCEKSHCFYYSRREGKVRNVVNAYLF